MVLTWLPSRFHSTHQFCFTAADQKEVKDPRSPCQVSCVSVWPVLAGLKLCCLADNSRQQELCFNANQSRKVLVHSALRFGLSEFCLGGISCFLEFDKLTTKRVLASFWILPLTQSERFWRDSLVAQFLLQDTVKQFFWTPPYTWKLSTLLILMKKLVHSLIKYPSTAL